MPRRRPPKTAKAEQIPDRGGGMPSTVGGHSNSQASSYVELFWYTLPINIFSGTHRPVFEAQSCPRLVGCQNRCVGGALKQTMTRSQISIESARSAGPHVSDLLDLARVAGQADAFESVLRSGFDSERPRSKNLRLVTSGYQGRIKNISNTWALLRKNMVFVCETLFFMGLRSAGIRCA